MGINRSEMSTDDDKFFNGLDERGYRPKEMFDQKGRTGRWNVDSLIEGGRMKKARVVEQEQQRAEAVARGGSRNGAGQQRGRGQGARGITQGWRGARGGAQQWRSSRGASVVRVSGRGRGGPRSTSTPVSAADDLVRATAELALNDTNFPGLNTRTNADFPTVASDHGQY